MSAKIVNRDPYFLKGREARNDYLPRKANPYSMKTEKGHQWDEGWLSIGERKVSYRSGDGKLKDLTMPRDPKDGHSNDDLNLPHTF